MSSDVTMMDFTINKGNTHEKCKKNLFFTVKMVMPRNRLPGEVMGSPTVEIVKSQSDVVLGSLFQLTLPK